MADRCAVFSGRERERHRERARIEPMAGVHEPRAGDVPREPRFAVSDVGGTRDVLDRETVPLGASDGFLGDPYFPGIHGGEHRADGFVVEPNVERRVGSDPPVRFEARASHRHVHIVVGKHPQALVAPGCVRREMVPLHQGHRGSP